MFKYRGGDTVRKGTYWCPATGQVVTISRAGGKLPDAQKRPYVRAPALLLVMAMPLLGLVYIIFLPFTGFAALLGYLGYRGWLGLRWAFTGVGHLATVEWRPGVSYLGRRARRPAKKDQAEEILRGLEEEIERRREEGE
ncbi:MAG: hypothetical protein HYX99_02550 [Chloroflexi bacterium]|nr:hypothetical protein [Chloroflexota bacterium]